MSDQKYLLLVEDNANITELILIALEERHPTLHVETVHDGAEALDFLHARVAMSNRPADLPAVILLDIKMPRIDGLEVLRQVKTHPRMKAIPVVMLTSSPHPGDLRMCYELGANAYVVKPAGFDELTIVMNQLAEFWTHVNMPPPSLSARDSLNAPALT